MKDGKIQCTAPFCKKMAVWCYGPATGNAFFCEDHVPRGCSCQDNEDGTPATDEQGRLLPCVEYDYEEDGFDYEECWEIRTTDGKGKILGDFKER